ncbi:hypothetical protein J6X73_03030 [Candidatus Saccharibacteria bacterium]|nr:hypothetical protein [Candidatus Saccharibacteria bacterium]
MHEFVVRFDGEMPREEVEKFLSKSENNDRTVYVINAYTKEVKNKDGIYDQRKWGDFVVFIYNGDDNMKILSFMRDYAGIDPKNPHLQPHPHFIDYYDNCYQKKEI